MSWAILVGWARGQGSARRWIVLASAIALVAADLPYQSPRLASGAWALYTSFAPAASGQVREMSLTADGKQRFYRVVLQTPP